MLLCQTCSLIFIIICSKILISQLAVNYEHCQEKYPLSFGTVKWAKYVEELLFNFYDFISNSQCSLKKGISQSLFRRLCSSGLRMLRCYVSFPG